MMNAVTWLKSSAAHASLLLLHERLTAKIGEEFNGGLHSL